MGTVPISLDDASLAKFLAKTELPVVVDFWADWCGPCKTMAPHFEAAAGRLPNVRFVKVDSDAAPQASARYGIRSIPTLIIFKDGKVLAQKVGGAPKKALSDWIKSSTGAGV